MVPEFDPMAIKKVQDILGELPPETQTAVSAVVPIIWGFGESDFDAWLNGLVDGPIDSSGKTFAESLSDLITFNAGADAAHAANLAQKQQMKDALKQIIITLLMAKLSV
jgi:hypothetical protein